MEAVSLGRSFLLTDDLLHVPGPGCAGELGLQQCLVRECFRVVCAEKARIWLQAEEGKTYPSHSPGRGGFPAGVVVQGLLAELGLHVSWVLPVGGLNRFNLVTLDAVEQILDACPLGIGEACNAQGFGLRQQ